MITVLIRAYFNIQVGGILPPSRQEVPPSQREIATHFFAPFRCLQCTQYAKNSLCLNIMRKSRNKLESVLDTNAVIADCWLGVLYKLGTDSIIFATRAAIIYTVVGMNIIMSQQPIADARSFKKLTPLRAWYNQGIADW